MAQNGVRSPQGFSIGLAAGGSAFTDFQRSNFQAQPSTGNLAQEQEFSRRVGAQTSGAVAGYLAFWPVQSWGLRLYGAFSPSQFRQMVPRSAGASADTASAEMAGLSIVQYHAQALFRLPTIKGRVVPYGIVGGGVVQYHVGRHGSLPAEAGTEFESGSRTKAAGSAGLGAMLQMRRPGWGLNFELIDNLSHTPLEPGPVRMINALSFTVGLSLRLSR